MISYKKLSASILFGSLAFATSGCMPAPDSAAIAPVSVQIQPQGQETTKAEKPRYIAVTHDSDRSTHLKSDPKDGSGHISLPNDQYFQLVSSETTDLSPNGLSPASGEEMNQLRFKASVDNPTAGLSVRVRIDGNDIGGLKITESSGDIFISAPQAAKIELVIKYDKVEQVLDAKSGHRISQGIAEIWYEERGLPSYDRWPQDVENVLPDGSTVNLRIGPTTAEPYMTAYSPEEGAGWANDGKDAWLIVETTGSYFSHSNGSLDGIECSITATDEDGNIYKPSRDFRYSYASETKYHFLVPSDATDYQIEVGCSAKDIVVDDVSMGPTGFLSSTFPITFE